MKKSTLDENKAHDEVEWWDPHMDVYSLNEKTLFDIFTWEIKVGAYINEEKTILRHFCKKMQDNELGRNFKNC
jgi:hypothetical protein